MLRDIRVQDVYHMTSSLH